LLTLDEQGFYEVRRAGGARSEAVSLAANLDLSESDLAHLDPEELVASVTFRTGEAADAAGASGTLSERSRRQDYWWYLLVAAFVLFATETVLSNQLSRAAR
jgi:hypothetical protein